MLRFIFIVVACQILLTACQKEPDVILPNNEIPVSLHFSAIVGDDSLDISQTYRNPFQEDIKVRTFKYYLHNIQFRNTSSGQLTSIPDIYHLIDPLDPASANIELTAPSGMYDQVSFVIGVDSIYNVSGAQAGDLDPAKGMFWTWNSGYIMAKLEGSSSFSNVANQAFEYHIGGFKGPDNVVRMISLPVNLHLDKASTIHLVSDVNAWFKGVNDIRISDLPVCTTPGQQAFMVAQNYYNMFRLKSIVQ
jgi:hypothetical protein